MFRPDLQRATSIKVLNTLSLRTHLPDCSAWSHDELASLDRCTLPWHGLHAGSHLIYSASREAKASLTSFIFSTPCGHAETMYTHSYERICFHFSVPDPSGPVPSLLICSTCWVRLSELLAVSPFIHAKPISNRKRGNEPHIRHKQWDISTWKKKNNSSVICNYKAIC